MTHIISHCLLQEKEEFSDSIIRDTAVLGVTYDKLTHTSDYFPEMLDLAERLIKKGSIYADDTPLEQMRAVSPVITGSIYCKQGFKQPFSCSCCLLWSSEPALTQLAARCELTLRVSSLQLTTNTTVCVSVTISRLPLVVLLLHCLDYCRNAGPTSTHSPSSLALWDNLVRIVLHGNIFWFYQL